jgi:hypothetical protein
MDQAFLRIEGVDLLNTVYDTQDLGATQGASLALLDAPRLVAEKYGLAEVWRGASQGVYHVPADRADAVVAGIRRDLASDPLFRHFRFVVDTAQSEPLAWAKNRIGQMQSLSVVLPEPGKTVCNVDRVRPALGGQDISAAVKDRRDYRGKLRKTFYETEIGVAEPEAIAHSFHDIVGHPPTGTPDALRNKMAVLYFDGNGFGGKIGLEPGKAATPDQVKAWRRDWMAALITALGGMAQAETVLWGGDEMMWIVPSWRAWECLDVCFAQMAQWPGGLTHAGGMVICHHKTPIRLAAQLARDLADRAKGARDRNAVQVEILESIDIPDGYLDRQRQKLFGGDGDFTMDAAEWQAFGERMKKIVAGFPRSQLYRLLKCDPADLAVETKKTLDDRDTKCSVPDLLGTTDKPRLHLARVAAFWDYYPQETPS